MHAARPASAARRADTVAAPAASASDQRRISTAASANGSLPRPDSKPRQPTTGAYVGASNHSESAWERTFNCEDNDTDLRDFWAIVLEGTSRAKLQVPCAPFVVLDAANEPVFVMLNQPAAEKKAGNAGGPAGVVESFFIEGGKSGVVWAALQQHIQAWPRVVIKRRIAHATSDKGSKGLSSTQLLLAQLVSGGSATNPLEVAKTFRHELVPRERAANLASVMMRLCQKRDDDAEEAQKADGSIVGRRKKDNDGHKVIQARLRDEAGHVIDSGLSEGVAGLKCAEFHQSFHRQLHILSQVLARNNIYQQRIIRSRAQIRRCHCCNH